MQPLRALHSAEEFLSAGLLAATDAREPRVREMYSEALVLWALSTPGDLADQPGGHLEHYRRLMPAAEPEEEIP